MSYTKKIKARELSVGDEIQVTVMGGTEFIPVDTVEIDDHVYYEGYSSVMGNMSDTFDLDFELVVRV